MNHDPLCGLSEPCDDEVPEHGYCSRQHGQFCIHCLTWCICDRLKQAEERTMAFIIQRIESLAWQSKGLDSTFSLRFIIQELRRQP